MNDRIYADTKAIKADLKDGEEPRKDPEEVNDHDGDGDDEGMKFDESRFRIIVIASRNSQDLVF
jgi:hypothetical protein